MAAEERMTDEMRYLQMLMDSRGEMDEKMISLLLSNEACRLIMYLQDSTVEQALSLSDSLIKEMFEEYQDFVQNQQLPIYGELLEDIISNPRFRKFGLNDRERLKDSFHLAQLVLMFIGFMAMATSIQIRRAESMTEQP